MTDTSVTQPAEDRIMKIPVVKAGKGVTVEIDLDNIDLGSYREALYLGLKALVNRKMTKLVSTKDMTGKELEEQRAAIMEVAERNVQDIVEGNVRKSAASKASGVPQAVKTEALRQIKVAIKAQLRSEGKKITYIPPKEITAAAKKEYEENPEAWNAKARTTLAAIEAAKQESGAIKLNIVEDTKLVAKAEKAKAERKAKGKAPVQHARTAQHVNA